MTWFILKFVRSDENAKINNLRRSNFLDKPTCNACVAIGKEPATQASKKQDKNEILIFVSLKKVNIF